MGEQATILDYANPERRRWRSTELFLRLVRATRWFLFQRLLNAAEVAVGGWLLWAALFTFWSARRFELGSSSLKPAIAFTLLLPCVVAAALARLAFRRRWRPLLVFALVVAAVVPMAGIVQFERCPHARYLQVLGISIPIEGDRCGNPRKVEPWWLRD